MDEKTLRYVCSLDSCGWTGHLDECTKTIVGGTYLASPVCPKCNSLVSFMLVEPDAAQEENKTDDEEDGVRVAKEAKPCHTCGGIFIEYDPDESSLTCIACGYYYQADENSDLDDLLKEWNKRTIEDELQVKLSQALEAVSQQSKIVQRDWVSPYEAEGLRGKIENLEKENERLKDELAEEETVSQKMRTFLIRLREEFLVLEKHARIRPISMNSTAFEKFEADIERVLKDNNVEGKPLEKLAQALELLEQLMEFGDEGVPEKYWTPRYKSVIEKAEALVGKRVVERPVVFTRER